MHSRRVSRRSHALTVLAGALLLGGCAGQNLFSALVATGAGQATVDITAPTDDFTLAAGATVQVNAEVNAPNGLVSAQYQGVYLEDGSAAFVQQTETFANVAFASLSTTLAPVVDPVPGDVFIIVTVTDGQGEATADSVKVKIN